MPQSGKIPNGENAVSTESLLDFKHCGCPVTREVSWEINGTIIFLDYQKPSRKRSLEVGIPLFAVKRIIIEDKILKYLKGWIKILQQFPDKKKIIDKNNVVMVIVVGSGHGDTSSNPGRG